PRRIGMHITLLVLLPTFALLTNWQFERAYNGNTLSWAYTFEWPLFAGYAIYVWWQLIHDDPVPFTRRPGTRLGPDGEPVGPEEEPGWALSGGRRSKHRAAPEAAANATAGAATMVGSPADPTPPTSGADQEPTDTHAEVEGEEADDEDPELAEYNRYLAELNAGPDRKRW
ncbi:MAG: hypothetical protein ACRDWB_09275, partial [Acidimicrobiales bacterium]